MANQYCPVKYSCASSKSLLRLEITPMSSGNDFNSLPWFGLTLSRLTAKEKTIASRPHGICSTHQACFAQGIQSLRRALWRQQECTLLLLLGSVPHHGFR